MSDLIQQTHRFSLLCICFFFFLNVKEQCFYYFSKAVKENLFSSKQRKQSALPCLLEVLAGFLAAAFVSAVQKVYMISRDFLFLHQKIGCQLNNSQNYFMCQVRGKVG